MNKTMKGGPIAIAASGEGASEPMAKPMALATNDSRVNTAIICANFLGLASRPHRGYRIAENIIGKHAVIGLSEMILPNRYGITPYDDLLPRALSRFTTIFSDPNSPRVLTREVIAVDTAADWTIQGHMAFGARGESKNKWRSLRLN